MLIGWILELIHRENYKLKKKLFAHLKNGHFFKAIGMGGPGSKKHVKLILKNSLLWFQRFLRNVKIQLRSEDMTNSIFGVLTFI